MVTFVSSEKVSFLPSSREGKGNTFTKGNLCPAFRQMEGWEKSFIYICCFFFFFSFNGRFNASVIKEMKFIMGMKSFNSN